MLWKRVPLLRRSLLDQPNSRSSHSIATPQGGGLAFVLVAGAASSLLGSWLPSLCLPLALVDLIDDHHTLPAGLRYGVQIATALMLVLTSPLPQLAATIPTALFVLPIGLLLVISAIAVINFTNFMDVPGVNYVGGRLPNCRRAMDGLDGLVAGCMAVVFCAAASSSANGLALWPLVGSMLPFLV